jgi:hypothetical protein
MLTRPVALALALVLSPLAAACTAPVEAAHPHSSSTQSSQTSETPGACAKSLADYCAAGSCTTSWSSASWTCSMAPTNPGQPELSGQWTMHDACGGYDVWAPGDGTTNYYDATSGALVAVTDAAGACVGGPATFTAPTGCDLTGCGFSCGAPPPPNGGATP